MESSFASLSLTWRQVYDGPCPSHAWYWQHRECLRPRRVPESGKLGSAPRLLRLRQRLLRHRPLYDRLDRVTDEFFFAYSVLAKPEYAFVPDVRLVLAKLWPHLVLDGSDCIGSGIDILYVCLDMSPSLSSRTMRMRLHVRLPRHRHPTTTTTTALSSRGYPDQGYTAPTLSATSTRHKGLSPRRAPRQLPLQSKLPRRDIVHDVPATTAGGCQPTGLLRFIPGLTVCDVPAVYDATATTARSVRNILGK